MEFAAKLSNKAAYRRDDTIAGSTGSYLSAGQRAGEEWTAGGEEKRCPHNNPIRQSSLKAFIEPTADRTIEESIVIASRTGFDKKCV